ncbi:MULTISPECIES: PD-(D/E)XK nuclease family protein [unclassified Novosphingobium]|uniref:PD-(D/E)XK nuclease family protein n=1 Tax=unclassified Novosphingobium TaxID=2644732 RepID=UPI0003F52DC8|nr:MULTISPECIES: PD-(D/E)XK nuclease family protein [unclassified Novosphingobium]
MSEQRLPVDLLRKFEKKLPILEAERRTAERHSAPRLNAFSILGPDERRITSVLSNLLDPSGHHGQGTLFLNCFLRAVGLPEVATFPEKVSITVDAFTDKGRMIDLLIETPNALMGVEVKIFANQSKNQLSDYSDYIEEMSRQILKRHGTRQMPWKLVFLAEQAPETAQSTVIRMPWARREDVEEEGVWAAPFRDIIEQAMPHIKAMRTRSLLDDFLNWIDQTFGNSSMSDDQFEGYAQEISQNFGDPTLRRALGMFMLNKAHQHLHRLAIEAIEKAILDALKKNWPDLQIEPGSTSLYERLIGQHCEWALRRPNWPKGAAIALQNDVRKPFGHVFFGLRALKANNFEAKNYAHMVCVERYIIDEIVTPELPRGETHPWWAWCINSKNTLWDTQFSARLMIESPDGDISQHPDVEFIINHLLLICKKMELLS